MDEIQIPISIGELLDKISIFSIKSQYTTKEIESAYQDILKNIEENSSKEIIKSKDITGMKYS